MNDERFEERIDELTKDEESDNESGGTGSDSDSNTVKTPSKYKLKKGKKIYTKKYILKVTYVKGKTAKCAIVGVRKKYRKNLKKVTINTFFKYKGYKVKVTYIGKKVFAKSKKINKVTDKGKYLNKISRYAFYKKVRKKLRVCANKKTRKMFLKSFGR